MSHFVLKDVNSIHPEPSCLPAIVPPEITVSAGPVKKRQGKSVAAPAPPILRGDESSSCTIWK
jgi:hypothetical protein